VAAEAKRVLAGELPLNFCNPEVLGAYEKRFAAEQIRRQPPLCGGSCRLGADLPC
jgi:hypothetical protein